MKPKVTIIDYGMGNLYSVKRAFEVCGAEVSIASQPEQIASAHHLVLPGVGAFQTGMEGLHKQNLVDSIREHALSGKPLMGICLGMQMFASTSEEFGKHEGIGLIPGRVLPLPKFDLDRKPQKIPRIGWVGLYKASDKDWRQTPLEELKEADTVYIVHSYSMHLSNRAHELAISWYGGHQVTTVIRFKNIIGYQFHPEKSGLIGLKILSSFIRPNPLFV